MSRFTKPGAIILDPFCGSGTCPAVCIEFGCHYLAFELDPQTAETARERLAEILPPIIIPEFQQLNMEMESL
jgi:DNA modification methylase